MPVLNFDGLSALSYDNQDTGPGDLLLDGGTATLNGNLWKRFSLPEPFTVAENSVLRLSLRSDRIGEIIAIGLDNNNTWQDGNPFFQLGGSQTRLPAGNQSYADYSQDMAGTTQDVVISLAAHAGQNFEYITLTNDADRIPGTDVTFSSIELLTPQQTDVSPDADDDAVVTTSGSVLTIPAADLLANDSDLNAGDTLTVTGVSGPADSAEGEVVISGGAVVFTPGDGFVGQTSFTYQITDSTGLTDEAVVTVTVQAPSEEVQVSVDASVISSYGAGQDTAGGTATVSDGGRTLTLAGNAWKKLELAIPFEVQADSVLQVSFRSDKVPEIAGIGLDNDNDWENGNPLFQLGGTQSAPGQFRKVDSYATVDGTVTYQFDLAPWLGDTFGFVTLINDADKGAAAGSNAVFSDIRLGSAGNVPPTADPASYTIADDEVLALSASDLLELADDIDGDPLTLDGVSGAVGGSVAIAGGMVTFTPNGTGEGRFDYTVSDGNGGVASATVTVTVNGQTGSAGNVSMNFAGLPTTNYGGQDGRGTATASSDGRALTLDGNTWDWVPLPAAYTIGSETVLRVELTAPAIGEIVAIGLDNNGRYKGETQPLFQLGGSQDWSGTDDSFRTYATPGETVAYEIPMGDYANFTATQLVLINDADKIGGTSATFANIALVDGATGDAPPVFTGSADLSVAEGETFVAAVTVTDPDSTDLTYGIAGTGADDALFVIDPGSGALRFKTAPDHEAPADADGDNVYEVDISVADATTAVTSSFSVSVGNVVEPGETPVGPPPDAYGSMYFFGDSLTDATEYGRFTQTLNGQPTANWADLLPGTLGATYAATSQYNYAVGGAQSGTDNVLNGRPSDTGFLSQVEDFATSGTAVAGNDIAAVWVGINDIWVSAQESVPTSQLAALGARPSTDALTQYVVGNIVAGAESLIDSGFEKILLLSSFDPEDGDNLPDNPTTNALVTTYATSVSNAMAGLSFDGAQSYFVDMVTLINDLEANADSYGFDFTDGSENLREAKLTNPTLDEQNAYMFYDEIHFTNGVHQLIAERAAETILTADGFDFVPIDYDEALNLV